MVFVPSVDKQIIDILHINLMLGYSEKWKLGSIINLLLLLLLPGHRFVQLDQIMRWWSSNLG